MLEILEMYMQTYRKNIERNPDLADFRKSKRNNGFLSNESDLKRYMTTEDKVNN